VTLFYSFVNLKGIMMADEKEMTLRELIEMLSHCRNWDAPVFVVDQKTMKRFPIKKVLPFSDGKRHSLVGVHIDVKGQ
jgi:hypothetical protein